MFDHADYAIEKSAEAFPCSAHMAIALIMEEHIGSYIEAITRDSRKQSSDVQHFSSAIYWKRSCQKAEAERLRLLDEIAELREERDNLRARVGQPLETKMVIGKRKRDTTSAGRNRANPTNKDGNEEECLSAGEIENTEAHQYEHRTLVRGFAALRRILQNEVPDQIGLVATIETITNSLSNALQGTNNEAGEQLAKTETQNLDDICSVSRHIYPFILQGLGTIRPRKHDGEQFFPALSSVVRLFQGFLGRLHKFALDEHVNRESQAKFKKRASRTRAKAAQGAASAPTLRDKSGHGKELAQMLVNMVTVLNVSLETHCELLEGVLSALLDHIGSSLSILVFSDENSTSGKQTGIIPPNGLSETAQVDLEAAVGTAKTEGPYLVLILRKSMEFLRSSIDHMPPRYQSLFSLRKPKSRSQDVWRMIEETLQKTLLRGVFGDDDTDFMNSLRRDEGALEQGLVEMMDEIEPQEESAEWFIGQLWEHLGWDILSGKLGT